MKGLKCACRTEEETGEAWRESVPEQRRPTLGLASWVQDATVGARCSSSSQVESRNGEITRLFHHRVRTTDRAAFPEHHSEPSP